MTDIIEPAPLRAICSSEFSSMERSMSIGHTAHSFTSEQDMKNILAKRYKTKLCRNYLETGKCPYDARCMFAHGGYELRSTQMNLDDGLVTEKAIRMFQRHRNSSPLAPRLCLSTDTMPATSGFPYVPGFTQQPFVASPCCCHSGHCCCCCSYSYSGCYCGGSFYDVPTLQNMPRKKRTKSSPLIIYTHNPYNQCVLPPESKLYGNPSFCEMMLLSYNDYVENNDMASSDYASTPKKVCKHTHCSVTDRNDQLKVKEEYQVDDNHSHNESVNIQSPLFSTVGLCDGGCDNNCSRSSKSEMEVGYSTCSSLGGVSADQLYLMQPSVSL